MIDQPVGAANMLTGYSLELEFLVLRNNDIRYDVVRRSQVDGQFKTISTVFVISVPTIKALGIFLS
ncbi:unnamed protein product [Penicillium camemberti]|uniref:Str. FM013 n=1 Tax=Penicillium camemberti (strain FM 013) TaxID=1429867 RepID=A0A0G4NT37_PENC3|nr:unnamed protein product [Penicillium camemberti]